MIAALVALSLVVATADEPKLSEAGQKEAEEVRGNVEGRQSGHQREC